MAKRLFLLLICSLIGVVSTPHFLTATDTVELSRMNATKAVETIIPPEPEPEPDPKTEPTYQPIVAHTSTTQIAISNPEPEAVIMPNAIAITGRVIPIVEVSDTTVDSGDHVNKYGGKFLYGHNSASVFGGLTSEGVGNVFTVSLNGNSTNYQIVKTVIYEKNAETGQLQLNGSGNYMRAVSNARSEGVAYSLALMTCYGTSYGNGDASHRLVIFANAI